MTSTDANRINKKRKRFIEESPNTPVFQKECLNILCGALTQYLESRPPLIHNLFSCNYSETMPGIMSGQLEIDIKRVSKIIRFFFKKQPFLEMWSSHNKGVFLTEFTNMMKTSFRQMNDDTGKEQTYRVNRFQRAPQNEKSFSNETGQICDMALLWTDAMLFFMLQSIADTEKHAMLCQKLCPQVEKRNENFVYRNDVQYVTSLFCGTALELLQSYHARCYDLSFSQLITTTINSWFCYHASNALKKPVNFDLIRWSDTKNGFITQGLMQKRKIGKSSDSFQGLYEANNNGRGLLCLQEKENKEYFNWHYVNIYNLHWNMGSHHRSATPKLKFSLIHKSTS
jgi:hypothetical protein